MPKTILITGATGQVSGALFPLLKGSGAKLRALVRNREKAASLPRQGVEVVEGDLGLHRTLSPAFEGVDTVWILAAPGPRAPEHSSNALWAARSAGVRYVVRMSAIGAGYDAPTINGRLHGLADAELMASGISYTILRPHFFMQNILTSAQSIASQGAMYLPFGEAKLPMIDTRDISQAAARVLTTGGHKNKTYTLTGPEAITLHDAANALGKALCRPVRYVPVPFPSAEEAMAKAGVDEWERAMLSDYVTAFNNNFAAEVTGDFESIVGRRARGIDQFANDFATRFGESNGQGGAKAS